MKGKPSKLTQKELERKLLPCMAYLHGDVEDGQFRAACSYECARESRILPKVAELFRRNRSADAMEIFFHIDGEFPAAGKHLIEHKWRVIWQCPSFPEKSWNELSKAERSDLLWGLPCLIRPEVFETLFPIPSVDQLRSMLHSGWKEARAGGRPIVESPCASFVYAVLPLDFSKTRKRIRQEIDDWLELPDNKARFGKHKQKTEAGTEKEAKDRLKDLAAWRLYRELGCDGTLSFAEENRKRDESGRPRPFHDWRRDQTKKLPPNEAPLYSEESGFPKAKKRAEGYLAKLIPWEFGEYAQEREH
jgi:hypothetical protein